MHIQIPELSLVILVGVSSSGKSTFAKKHFEKYETISSDVCRGIVSNSESNQHATKDAFDLLHHIAEKRLKSGLLTVVDATNIRTEDREKLVQLARGQHALPVAIIFDLPVSVCQERLELRTDRNFGAQVIRKQKQQLRKGLRGIKREGIRKVIRFKSQEEIDNIEGIEREKLFSNKKDIVGPFDIIGDIHGCYDETVELTTKEGYYGNEVVHPANRTVIFLGDLVDRGPNSPAVLKLVMSMVESGVAYCVPGNHDVKLQKKLRGKNVSLTHGLDVTMEQLESETDEFKQEVAEFIYKLTSHYIFDKGNLLVAHAGLREEMHGRASGTVRSFCLYGETTGESDEFGLPIRYNWATEYKGKTKVVYGHVAVAEAEWFNNTIDIDTGCVFGGELTALRYPEEELVQVEAKRVYCQPAKPLPQLNSNSLTSQQEHDDLLCIDDLLGKQIIQSRLRNNITIPEANSIAALEKMSRFAVNPKWLIYLPPTMSPCATSKIDNYLEHPIEAINYYKKNNVKQIVCEEKHMGSRAIIIICKDEEAVLRRFGIDNGGIGVCYTRTGRNFFNDKEFAGIFLGRINSALTNANFWEKYNTDWVCLDVEIMPWSAKAQALLSNQYASVGTAAKNSLKEVERILQKTSNRGLKELELEINRFSNKKESLDKFIKSYQNYCWEVNSIDDYKVAPFHILATEGAVHVDKTHIWHMENIKTICQADEAFMLATQYKVVETDNEASIENAIDWWLGLTAEGGEGMVVKPLDFIAYGKKGLLQPAVKCRGSEYLRIIYGPEYDTPSNLVRLKNRNLRRKRALADNEFALSVEALERFVRKEPLRRIHESVFSILALESEEIDPRL
ncbi:UNVERIFIED_CONTAM: hypothetical protein GTU68_061654 [Idotea baltica]|nr:hypothetical protein [Idotea baltica]